MAMNFVACVIVIALVFITSSVWQTTQRKDLLGYPNGAIGAAGVTVIVIHIIVGFYIWVAIQEEKEPAPIKQD